MRMRTRVDGREGEGCECEERALKDAREEGNME